MTEGTKYHPLFEYLLFSGQGRLSMSFSEIESLIGGRLPPSARKREEWWSNSQSGHSQARAWMRANYRTSNVDLKRETVTFTLEDWPEGYRRANIGSKDSNRLPGFGEATQAAFESTHIAKGSGELDHPLFGIWVGKVTLVPGYDYTKPVFEPEAAS